MQLSTDLYSFIEPVTRKHFGMGSKNHKPVFSRIADVSSTDEPIREFQENAGIGLLELKPEGQSMQTKAITPGPNRRVQAATFALAAQFSREILDDIKDSANSAALRKVTNASSLMGRAVKLTPEYLHAQFMDRSFNSAYPVTVDGVNLCSASHLSPLGTTYSNVPSIASALTESSLEDIKTQLMNTAAADGLLTPIMMEQVITTTANANLMEKLARSNKTLGSANNDPSVVAGTKYVIDPYLSSASPARWWVQTDAENGFYWQWRKETQYERDNVALSLGVVMLAFFRAMWGAEDPRCVIGVNAS